MQHNIYMCTLMGWSDSCQCPWMQVLLYVCMHIYKYIHTRIYCQQTQAFDMGTLTCFPRGLAPCVAVGSARQAQSAEQAQWTLCLCTGQAVETNKKESTWQAHVTGCIATHICYQRCNNILGMVWHMLVYYVSQSLGTCRHQHLKWQINGAWLGMQLKVWPFI